LEEEIMINFFIGFAIGVAIYILGYYFGRRNVIKELEVIKMSYLVKK
jgi:hypothetical protein